MEFDTGVAPRPASGIWTGIEAGIEAGIQAGIQAGIAAGIAIGIERPDRPDVVALLTEHLAEMHATSPAGSVHALDLTALTQPSITFVTARAGATLLGCGALSRLSAREGELKSMRTRAEVRGKGVAAAILEWLLAESRGSVSRPAARSTSRRPAGSTPDTDSRSAGLSAATSRTPTACS